MSALATPRTRPAVMPGRRHLRVVRETRVRRPLPYVVAGVLLSAATIFGAVAFDGLAAGQSVRARELEVRVATAERHYATLVAEVARLEDPERIRSAAGDLGLVPAGPRRYVEVLRTLPADGAVTELVTPGETADPMKPVLSAER